jgi:hypothetical protein
MTEKPAVPKVEDPFAVGANLDLSGFPQYQGALASDSTDAFLGEDTYLVAENKNSLKQGILSLVNSQDVEASQHLRAAGVEDATANKTFFLASGEKAIVYLKGGIWKVTCFHEDGTQETITTTAETREQAQTQVARFFSKKTLTSRKLTEGELLYVTRLVQTGKLEDALVNHVYFAIGEQAENFYDDPRVTPFCNAACWFCFEQMEPNFTEEARAYMERYLANKPVVTIPLLRSAFESFEIEKARADRPVLLPREPAPEPEIDIEDLSDAEIAELKTRSLQEYARQRR